MPVPLVPLAGVALKYGAVALAAWAAQAALRARIAQGRTDQRAEDALDDLPDGLAAHRPRDRDQRNAAMRLQRRFRFKGQDYDLDIAALARFRLSRR
jgi:hypothetical protein